jgi:hypothetical protein
VEGGSTSIGAQLLRCFLSTTARGAVEGMEGFRSALAFERGTVEGIDGFRSTSTVDGIDGFRSVDAPGVEFVENANELRLELGIDDEELERDGV